MWDQYAVWHRILLAVVIAAAAFFLLRRHDASGAGLPSESVTAGHRLAEAWCEECHAIGPIATETKRGPPAFAAVPHRRSTTALSIKVFLQTSHPTMPNIIVNPSQADDLANYILSLRRE